MIRQLGPGPARWRHQLVLGLLILIHGLAGCDALPPPESPPEAASGSSPRARRVARTVALVCPTTERLFDQLVEQFMRQETGKRGMLFQAYRPSGASPTQAALIREAARKAPSVLMVIPELSSDITESLEAAKLAGVPIILLDVPAGMNLPYPAVRTRDYDMEARALVAAGIQDAQAQGFPAEGPAVIVRADDEADRTPERVDALKRAAVSANLALVDEARYVPALGAETPLKATLEKHLDLALILAEDDLGIEAAANVRVAMDPQGKFAIAGFTVQAPITTMVKDGEVAATADRNLMGLVRDALGMTEAMLKDGVQPAGQVEVPLVTKRGVTDRSQRPIPLPQMTLDPPAERP